MLRRGEVAEARLLLETVRERWGATPEVAALFVRLGEAEAKAQAEAERRRYDDSYSGAANQIGDTYRWLTSRKPVGGLAPPQQNWRALSAMAGLFFLFGICVIDRTHGWRNTMATMEAGFFLLLACGCSYSAWRAHRRDGD